MRLRRICCAVLLFALCCLSAPLPVSATNVNAKLVRVAVCPHTPPFQFLDENYLLSGIHIDIMDYIAQQNNLSIVYTTYNTKSECINALNRGVVDLVLGYQTQEYDETDHLLTSELSAGSISIVGNKNLATYIEQTHRTTPFAISFEYGAVDYSLLHSLGFHRLLGVGNQEQAMESLLSQHADTTVGVSESIDFILHQRGAEKEFKTIHGRVGTIQYAILVSKGDPSLYRMLDKALIELHTSGVYEEIRDRWVPNRSEQQLRLAISILVPVALLTLFIVAVVLWFNHLLRKKVEVKTRLLHQANQSLEKTIIKLENEGIFRSQMIRSLPVGAVLFNRDYLIALTNPKAREICGFHSPEEVCRDARDLPVFGTILQQLDGAVFLPDPQVEHRRFFDLGSPAAPQKYRCWIHRLMEEDRFVGALMMVENITQEVLRRNERFAIEKANTLNQVVAGIAHEIKNPLMTIKTAVSLMSTQWENPDVKDAFIRFIPDEVDRMNTLVQSLLTYAKPPNEEFSVFRLSEVVMRSFHLAKITDNKSQIHFSVTLDDTLYIRGQRDLLRQALTNLLLNGIWAVNKKWEQAQLEDWAGSICGSIYADGDWACLSICDNGVGMSADVVSRCMEPFFTTKMAGTGLGLALAKQCVENSSGTMSIRSEENQYTEILIRFPQYRPDDGQADSEVKH